MFQVFQGALKVLYLLHFFDGTPTRYTLRNTLTVFHFFQWNTLTVFHFFPRVFHLGCSTYFLT